VLFGFVVIAGFASAGFFSDDSNAVFGFYLGHFLLGEFDRIFTHQLHMEKRLTDASRFRFSLSPSALLPLLYFTLCDAHTLKHWMAGFCCCLAFNP